MDISSSDRAFSGSVPEAYETLLVPLIFEPYATDLAERLNDFTEGTLLEIAAGTGVVTRQLAALLPSAVIITATDLSQDMIDRATHVGTARPITWQQADVMELPFPDDSFDVVVCQFGVMFFDPKSAAFAEMHRVLRPGGRLLFSVWLGLADNELAKVVSESAQKYVDARAASFIARVPHGYYDQELIATDVHHGGFTSSPTFDQVTRQTAPITPHNAAVAYCTGTPLRGGLEAGGLSNLNAAITDATAAIEARFGPQSFTDSIGALVVSVTK